MTVTTSAVTWDGHTGDELAANCGAARLELLAETDSTQNVAHALAEAGAPAGTVVLADSQSAGRGRLGHSWSSERGAGVWCTVIERPPSPDALDVLSLRVGLYAAENLDPFVGETVHVKWPNDLVIPWSEATRDLLYRKLGGILVEARWIGQSLAWVAIGVGVNVTAPANVPEAIGLKTSVRRADVFSAIVHAVRDAAMQRRHLTASELRRFSDRDGLAGRRILSPVEGIVAGVTAAGALTIETSRGTEYIRTGTVELARANEGRRT